MTKKHFIALADKIQEHNRTGRTDDYTDTGFTADQLDTLADFCASCNPRFDRERWLAYIAGDCGPSGESVR